MLNEYEIAYYDADVKPSKYEVIGTAKAPNGIEAIKFLLTRKFAGDKDMIDAILSAKSIVNNKSLTTAGLTVYAKKLS